MKSAIDSTSSFSSLSMEATRKVVAATNDTSANRRRNFGSVSYNSRSRSRSRSRSTGRNIHNHNNGRSNRNSDIDTGSGSGSGSSRGNVPLLQGCHIVDSLDYQPLESLLTTSISSAATASARSAIKPRDDDTFAEEWLLFGRTKSSTDCSACVSETPSPTGIKQTFWNGTPPTTATASSTSSTATASSSRRRDDARSSFSRGRSPLRPLVSPKLWQSPQRQQHHLLQQRQTRSLEPRRRSFRRRNHTAVPEPTAKRPQYELNHATHPENHRYTMGASTTGFTGSSTCTAGSSSTSTTGSTSTSIPPFNAFPANGISPVGVTPGALEAPIPGTPTGIPKDYVDCIVAAFGPQVNLYRDVLRVGEEDSPIAITPAKLRVAYFRQGRHVMHVGSGTRTDVSDSTVTPKQRFQAVTKAYEILTNPAWKACYDAHGLRLTRPTPPAPGVSPNAQSVPKHGPATPTVTRRKLVYPHPEPRSGTDIEDDEADASSVYSGTSVYSGMSILRRSNSWGPTQSRSRSTSRTRVCWSEEVEELVYQPDPLNSSGETKESSFESDGTNQASSRPKKSRKSRCVIDSTGLTADLEQLDTNFRRDFLDDLEASMDGLEAKIGGFVKYALSNEKNQTAENNSGEGKKSDDYDNDYGNHEGADGIDTDDTSSIAERLFSHLTAPAQTTDFSSFNTAIPVITTRQTKSAPMKEANNGQPRVTPKKKIHKRKVDRVPSEVEMKEIRGPEMIEEVFEDPLDSDVTTAKAWNVQNAVASMATFLGAGPATASTSLSKSGNVVSSASDYHRRDELLAYYDLQSNSSILASLAELSSHAEETATVSEKASEAETGLNFGVVNTLTHSEALDVSTDATTKGFVRLDRHTERRSDAIQSPLDTSDITYISKTTAELMSSNMPDCFGAFAKQARETLREVASVDEADTTGRGVGTDNVTHAATSSGDSTFLSSIGAYLHSLVEDVKVLGRSIGANLGEANRTVVETMSFTDDEFDGMLRVLESELSSPGGNINEVPTTFRTQPH